MMYRPHPPGMGVDPWYENFKFFLTYWLLSSNNRDRDGDQLPPLPPNGPQGHPFMSQPPHHKNGGHEGQGQSHQNTTSSKSPSSGPSSAGNNQPINWDTIEKNQQNGNSQRVGGQNLSLANSYADSLNLKQPLPSQAGPHPMGGGGGNNPHPMNGHGNSVIPEHLIIDKDRRHVCPHCYKGFRSRQQLNQHNLVHSGIRKYHCLYCERAFKQLSHLQQHHRIHTGEKPYRCPLDGCDKAFAQMSNLQHHMRQHDKSTFGQKQCMCPFCDRGYASEKSLKSHLSKMHPDSKLLGLGGQRSNLPLMDGQSHPMLGSPQPGVTISHHNSIPMMHHKSPLTPPGGPLELTINAHQRNAAMGSDARKYSLDTDKFGMNSGMSHESKIFQRSLSERLPDRGHNKLDSMFEQRFGLQNHLRDMNRFNDRSFEPFSPSRFHEAIRSFDFKEIEAKLFDHNGDTLQRMAESFNEFRSRFQDQMFRRDGTRQGSMGFEGRNFMPDMNDRNMFFNSRNDMMETLGSRDRYENSRNFNGMNVNGMDTYGPSRHDDIRQRSRSEMESRNSLSSPNYSRNDMVSDNLSMNMDSHISMNMRRNSLNMDPNIGARNSSANSDMLMSRGTDSGQNADSHLRSSQRNDMGMPPRNSLDMSMTDGRSSIDITMTPNGRRSIDMNMSSDRNGLDLNMNGGRIMQPPLSRTDSRNNCSSVVSQDKNMMMSTPNTLDSHQKMSIDKENQNSERMGMNLVDRPSDGMGMDMVDQSSDTGLPMDIVDRGTERMDDFGQRMNKSDLNKTSRGDFDMMDRNSMRMNTERRLDDKVSQNESMNIDDNMNIGSVSRDNRDMHIHSRGNNMAMGLCNDIDMEDPNTGYPDKPDMQRQNMMMADNSMRGNMQNEIDYSRGGSLPQMPAQHSAQKQNGHANVLQDDDMDYVSRSDDKNSPTSNHISDPSIIRQRKQRKPANPQHVFMPSIDHYTSFAVDEVEDCSALI